MERGGRVEDRYIRRLSAHGDGEVPTEHSTGSGQMDCGAGTDQIVHGANDRLTALSRCSGNGQWENVSEGGK